jgi:acetyl esterase/lipase
MNRISVLRWCALFLLALTPCSQAEPPLAPGPKVLKDLPYVTGGHPNQRLDLYLPAQPTGPLLVTIHGGGWRAGSKSDAMGVGLLQHGVVVASIEYRFSQHAPFPAQIEDCKAAIRWLRAHAAEYGYDPRRVGAWGASAGGHLTALLATTGGTRDFDVGENLEQSSAIQCGIDVFGPTDFPGWVPPSDNPAIQRSGPNSLLTLLLGGEMEEKMELAKRASPLTWAAKDCAPLQILHGTTDPLVGLDQSQRLTDKLKGLGVEVTLDVVEGAGHGGPQFTTPERIGRVLEFLKRHLVQL